MNYDYEQNLINQGYEFICGIDEAGRGPFAGPLVSAAVVLDPLNTELFGLLNDSKLVSEKHRKAILPMILCKAKSWSIGAASSYEIDKHGLSYANKIAMKRAWKYLSLKPNFILSDYMAKLVFETPYELIKSGDKKVASIAAASIVAKVFRDRMMDAFAKKYPEYGFESHKGYGTQFHRDQLEWLGPCDIHRKSFEPIKAKLL
ncbi:ribonuclease HII [Candidatus Falkowbacteria bacterium]|jgi:ribonuclease HII|nr:ribonuclease HII [Candidatus Falkowbacteria bacterium]MBT7006973.1 ribonuclease HII [Candidatus Falkowbacteria bacterium]